MSTKEASKLPFEEKRKWFRAALELLRIPWTQGADTLKIDKSQLLDTSVKAYRKCNLFKVKSND